MSLPGTHYPVAVVGGGQAGLSVSYCLRERGIEHVVAGGAPGRRTSGGPAAGTPSAWSPRTGSAGCPVSPTRDRTRTGSWSATRSCAYLEEYVAIFAPPLVEGVAVAGLRRDRLRTVRLSTPGRRADRRPGGRRHRPVPRARGPAAGRAAARPTSCSCTPRLPQPRRSFPTARSWWSAPASPAARSPRTCTSRAARSTWRSAARPGWPGSTGAGTAWPGWTRWATTPRASTSFDDARRGPDAGQPLRDRPRRRPRHRPAGLRPRRHAAVRAADRHRRTARCGSPTTCKINLDHADAVAEGIKDAIDAYIAAHGIEAPEEARYRPVWEPAPAVRRDWICGGRHHAR